jgi:hypothetical protein
MSENAHLLKTFSDRIGKPNAHINPLLFIFIN